MPSMGRFVRDESGTTAIEYTLIAACISVAILLAAQSLGSSLSGVFDTIAAALAAI